MGKHINVAMLAVGLFAAVSGSGCHQIPPPQRPISELAGVPFLFLSSGDSPTSAVSAASWILRSAGFNLISLPMFDINGTKNSQPTEAKFVFSMSISQGKTGLIYQGHTVRISVGAESEGINAVNVSDEFNFDTMRPDFCKQLDQRYLPSSCQGGSEVDPNSNKVRGLINTLLSSQEFRNFERALARQLPIRAKARHQLWFDKYALSCVDPTHGNDCDDLEKWYLHTAPVIGSQEFDWTLEAKRILKDSALQIHILKDEESWAKSGINDCLSKADSESCAGVSEYMQGFPKGSHCTEANQALEAMRLMIEKRAADQIEADKRKAAEQAEAEKRKAALEREQQRNQAEKHRAEQERQQKEKDRQQCKQNCKNNCASITQEDLFKKCIGECSAQCK